MPVKPATIDAYLATVDADKRPALQKLRRAIQAAAPKAEECISYGLAAFRLDGRPLVAFGATANHCAFFPMSSTTVEAHKADLEKYETTKGTIRFQPKKPLPTSLVRKLVKARIAENVNRKESASANKKTNAKSVKADSKFDPAVVEFLRELDHPLKKDFETVRKIIHGVSPAICEGIKWNTVSFRTTEYFATINWRCRDSVQLVFHLGAKVKDNTHAMKISDPEGLVKWLAKDRCLVTLGTGKEIAKRKKAFETIVRQWLRQMGGN